MDIAFHVASATGTEGVMQNTTDRLMELRRRHEPITRVRVYLRQQMPLVGDQKVCEIDCTIYGYSIFVHQVAADYEEACQRALVVLTEKVKARTREVNRTARLETCL